MFSVEMSSVLAHLAVVLSFIFVTINIIPNKLMECEKNLLEKKMTEVKMT